MKKTTEHQAGQYSREKPPAKMSAWPLSEEIDSKDNTKMKVEFSRHAKRRAKLYNIPESTIEEILKESDFRDGEHEVIKDVQGFKYPIKTVVSVEGNILTVITNYPLKKGRRQ